MLPQDIQRMSLCCKSIRNFRSSVELQFICQNDIMCSVVTKTARLIEVLEYTDERCVA